LGNCPRFFSIFRKLHLGNIHLTHYVLANTNTIFLFNYTSLHFHLFFSILFLLIFWNLVQPFVKGWFGTEFFAQSKSPSSSRRTSRTSLSITYLEVCPSLFKTDYRRVVGALVNFGRLPVKPHRIC
jgi:hypothetical protein